MITLSNYMPALSSSWKQNKHVVFNLLKRRAKCIPGTYRPQTTWLYVNRTLGNSGSIILPCKGYYCFCCVGNVVRPKIHMELVLQTLRKDMVPAGIVTVCGRNKADLGKNWSCS